MPPPKENVSAIMPSKPNVTSENALVPFTATDNNDLWDDDFDLMAAIAETQQAEMDTNFTTTTSVSKQLVKKTMNPMPNIFQNCKIEGNITINFNK